MIYGVYTCRLKKIQEKKKKIKARAEVEAKLRQAAMETEDIDRGDGKYDVCMSGSVPSRLAYKTM